MEKQVVVIAGPSGGGKNSIIQELLKRYHNCSRLVTATTRAPRAGEEEGVDYHFLSEPDFMAALERGDILEHRSVPQLGTHYGVYKPDIEARLSRGDVVLAHLDIVGARKLKQLYNAVTIFVLPDSADALEKRIRARNPQMSEEEVQTRLTIGRREMEEDIKEYDHVVINAQGKLAEAVDMVAGILIEEGFTLEQ